MSLEPVLVRFLLGDGTPGQLSSPNSHTAAPEFLTEGDYSALRGGSTNNAEYHTTENIFGTNKQLRSACVIPEMGGERHKQRQSVPWAT